MNRREVIKTLVTATVSGPVVFELSGCPKNALQELETWVPIGIDAFTGAVAIANPAAGSAMFLDAQAANAAWLILRTDIQNYQNAPAADKATAEGKILTGINVVMGNLNQVISLIPQAQEYTATVTAALRLVLDTIEAIYTNLEPATTASAKAARKAATAKAPKNLGDFKKKYNAIVVNGRHPEKQLH